MNCNRRIRIITLMNNKRQLPLSPLSNYLSSSIHFFKKILNTPLSCQNYLLEGKLALGAQKSNQSNQLKLLCSKYETYYKYEFRNSNYKNSNSLSISGKLSFHRFCSFVRYVQHAGFYIRYKWIKFSLQKNRYRSKVRSIWDMGTPA